jgi:antitoxin component YwqK of YwqJK toxin-antitoxin module
MENFKEIKENILNYTIDKNGGGYIIEKVKACESWDELQEVIAEFIHFLTTFGKVIPDGFYKTRQHEFTILNGKLHGEYKECLESGELIQFSFYKNGKLDREFKSWYKNGQPSLYCSLKEGKIDGKYNQWHKNGHPEIQCFYKNGERDGECRYWYNNGKLYVQYKYKDGLLHGKYYGYDESGKPIVKQYYTNGKTNNFRTFIFKHFNI